MNLFIKYRLNLVLVLVFIGVCAVSAHAQKQLKYVPQALKGAKTIPYVVNPKLPPTVRANFAMPVVRPNISTGVERQVVQAQTAAQLPQQKDFLTGLQALQKFRPGWKSELMLSGFTRQQLAAIEEAFAETDEMLFELDENSKWVDWQYSKWFSFVLTDKIALSDGQVKTLFGKFSRLDDVFTRLNLQAFSLVNKRAPKTNAPGEEGKLARHAKYNLDKRDGRKMNPEVEEYVYGKSEPLRKKSTVGTKTPQAKIVAPEVTKPADLGNSVLELKSVDAYYPAWRAELGAMFDKEQLDTIERTFAVTDEQIFVRGDDGELTVRNPNEWDYEARFLTILQNSGVSFTHKQIKQLIGGTNSRGFKFYNYFTLRNTMAFALATGHLPRKGLQVSLTELRKQANAGDSRAEELVRELTLGNKITVKGWLNDPVHGDMHALITNEKYLNIAQVKTPQEWLVLYKEFVIAHHRTPSDKIEEEKALYNGAHKAMKYHPNDPASVEMRELKEKYKLFEERKSPQEWLDLLKAFIREYDRWPSAEIAEEKQLYHGAQNAMRSNPNDPVSVEMKELKEIYEGLSASPKSPQEWLDMLEAFIREHDRWPSGEIAEEKQLYTGTKNAMRSNPNDPASVKMRELRKTYDGLYANRRTPQEWLEVIESFVREHNRWPSPSIEGEKQLYLGARDAMKRQPNNPASVRMRELKEKYQ